MLPLPIAFDLPLPKLTRLPQGALMAGGMGYIYGKVTDVPAFTCAKLFTIMHLANSILFLLVKTRLGLEEKRYNEQQLRLVLLCTTALTHVIGIIAMRHFELIGTKGTVVWSLLSLGVCLAQLNQGLNILDEKMFDLSDVM